MSDHSTKLDRRELLLGSLGGALATAAAPALGLAQSSSAQSSADSGQAFRARFPRLAQETYLNAAGATPLGDFAQAGLERYMTFQHLGPGAGRRDAFFAMWSELRGLFATLIGADESEIALVHCTKAGEQIVLDGLESLARGHNIVSNDLHFSRSVHNLIGRQKAGADVRIVRNRDWDVSLEQMKAAIDDRTALVSIALVSNVNGKIEDVRALSEIAHAHGALLYADIIQATGILPLDMRAMGIDFAAANGYKWLYGVHGAGFLYVRQALQGTALTDRLFPGRARFNYPPWVERPDSEAEDIPYHPPEDARRYEPGHVSYLGYCAVYEGLKMLQTVGVENALAHSLRLNQRLRAGLDPERFPCITPSPERSPINAFRVDDAKAMGERLAADRITVSLGSGIMRVSPALYNTEEDIDRLLAAVAREPAA